jgi:hypothetical protein
LETKFTNEEEIKLSSSNKARLSMKALHNLIKDIQHQDQILVQRIEHLEQSISEIYQTREEIAVANEQLRIQDEIMTQETHAQVQTQEIRVSRAIRHALPRKKSFWFWK